MIKVPLPALTRGLSAVRTESVAAAASVTARASVRISRSPLREDEVELAPVLLSGCALARPVGCVIELVGDLRRPVAADVAVEQIALDGLAQTGGPAGALRFPPGREHERAADGKVRQQRRPGPLQRDDVRLGRALDARRFAV